MTCDPCKRGDHCGKPGAPTPQCTCQHYPRGTGQQAARPSVDPSPVSLVQPPLARGSEGRTELPVLASLRRYLKTRRPRG